MPLPSSFDPMQYKARRDFIPLDSVDSLVLERDPTFEHYLFFHNLLDKICWCAKLHYSDRETVKRKRYRLDTLFQNVLRTEATSLDKAKACIHSNADAERLEYHITKGWLNELVRSHPLHPDYLFIGTNLGQWSTPGAGGFASWNIIQSYYSFYEYIAAVCAALDPAAKADGRNVRGPIFQQSRYRQRGRPSGLLPVYAYKLDKKLPHPSAPLQLPLRHVPTGSGPIDHGTGAGTRSSLQVAQLGKPWHKDLVFDLFYALRLWSNYTGVQSVMALSDGGTKSSCREIWQPLSFLLAAWPNSPT